MQKAIHPSPYFFLIAYLIFFEIETHKIYLGGKCRDLKQLEQIFTEREKRKKRSCLYDPSKKMFTIWPVLKKDEFGRFYRLEFFTAQERRN